MQFNLSGDNLKRRNGTTFNVFNQHSKIEKLKVPYKNILKTNIEQFLKKATNSIINTDDVLQHLKTLGLINDKITSNNDYKLIDNKALEDKNNERLLGENEKKRRHRKNKNDPNDINGKALKFILNDIKLPEKKNS